MTTRNRRGSRRSAKKSPAFVLAAFLCALTVAVSIDTAAARREPVVAASAAKVSFDASAALQQAKAEAVSYSKAQAAAVAAAQTTVRPAALQQTTSAAVSVAPSEEPAAEKTVVAEVASEKVTEEPTPEKAVVNDKNDPNAQFVTSAATFQAAAYGDSHANRIPQWKAYNNDVVGYLYIPGTNIDYPVVWNADINYYTAKGYDKQYSKNGVLWVNPDWNSTDRTNLPQNTVIYGHNWTNYSANPAIGRSSDVMFAQLTAYHYLDQVKKYPFFYFSTPNDQMVFQIFAVFYTEPSFIYNATNYGSTQNFASMLTEAVTRSRFVFNSPLSANDKIVTLSTCTRAYGATNNQRFVVMGRLLRDGETIRPIDVVYNANHKQPNVWAK